MGFYLHCPTFSFWQSGLGGHVLHEMTWDWGTLQEADEAAGNVEDEAVEEPAGEEAEEPPVEVVVPQGANRFTSPCHSSAEFVSVIRPG